MKIMKNAMLSLMRLVVVFSLLVPSVHAGLYFTAGSGEVNPGGLVTIPITVSSTINDPWISLDLALQWNSSVFTFNSAGAVSPFTTGSAIFNSGTLGALSLSWANGSGSTVADPATIFTLTLSTAGDAPLGPETISFSSLPKVGFLNSGEKTADGTYPGTITVVPEPVNYALAGLACVFLGAKTISWFSRKRVAR
jgi:hypothetical protein